MIANPPEKRESQSSREFLRIFVLLNKGGKWTKKGQQAVYLAPRGVFGGPLDPAWIGAGSNLDVPWRRVWKLDQSKFASRRLHQFVLKGTYFCTLQTSTDHQSKQKMQCFASLRLRPFSRGPPPGGPLHSSMVRVTWSFENGDCAPRRCQCASLEPKKVLCLSESGRPPEPNRNQLSHLVTVK